MVVFPPSSPEFAASEAAADRPLSHARIGYQSWTLDLANSSASASSAADDGPADAVLRPDTAEYWEPTSLPATLTIDFGQQRAVDYVGISPGHTLSSAGCSLLVEWSDGVQVGSPLALAYTPFSDSIAPDDDSAIMLLDTIVSARYLRLYVSGGTVMPRIPVVYAGQVLVMPRPIYGGQSPMSLSRETELKHSLSRGGQFLGQDFQRHGQVGTGGPWRHLSPSWYRTYFEPFVQAARRYPFFYAWRPEDFPEDVSFAWSTGDIRPSTMGLRNFMQVSFEMRGLGHE